MDIYLTCYENMYRRDDLFCVCKPKKLRFGGNTRSLQHREGELVIPERGNYKRYKETIMPVCVVILILVIIMANITSYKARFQALACVDSLNLHDNAMR